MPRLWTDTIASHKEEVRDAILDSVGELVGDRSLFGASMSGVAERVGIGRATLYKYFADIRSMVVAWHVRQMNRHADHLAAAAHGSGDALTRLHDVLRRHVEVLAAHHPHETVSAVLLPSGTADMALAEGRMIQLVAALITQGAAERSVRNDLPAEDLARYALNAAAAAATADQPAALIDLVIDGLAPTSHS